MTFPRRRRRLPVLTYLLLAFGTAVAGIGALLISTNLGDSARERRRVTTSLASAVELALSDAADYDRQLLEFMRPVATEAGAHDFDPARCGEVFKGLGGVISDAGHLHLIGPDGTEVCSVVPQGVDGAFSLGDWDADLDVARPEAGAPRVDPVTGRPAQPLLFPVTSPAGRTGLLAGVLYLDTFHLELPQGLPEGSTLFEIDGDRTAVLRTSADAGDLAGRSLAGTGLARAVPDGGATLAGFDGQKLFVVEASDSGRTLVATVPSSMVTATARKEFREALTWCGLAALLISALGLILHRRLARPMRRITAAIRSAANGADGVWAPVEGPAELGVMAEAFNQMLADRRAREADLQHRATHDVLTGLPNRAALTANLGAVLAGGRSAALLFLDLDRFKLVNDSHGHNVGDSVLGDLGVRLSREVRPDDTVARFGGDEFVVLCPDIDDERAALEIARRITLTLEHPFTADGHELFLTGSVGVAVGRPGDHPEDLLRAADTAMYEAKGRGRPGYAFFDEEMRIRSCRRLELEQELHSALERCEMSLVYQPILDPRRGLVAGAEALLRWNNGLKGAVSPVEFIPIAEETGVVVALGEWVLHEACRQSAAWREELGRGVRVSVNVAARQLSRPGLASVVSSALLGSGAQPQDLVLEITEHGVLEDFAVAYRQLQEVRALGVRVSVDDFGTGWSSLSYLQRLPVDELKIDRSFVATLGVDGPSAAIVGSLVDMAHGLNLEVVAEGVETVEQLDELRRLGCDLVQGFLLARPGPAAAISALVREPAAYHRVR